MKTVIPVGAELILKKDGHVKNGSEQEAAKRFIQNLQREHPHLKAIIIGDSLHSKGPFIRELQSAGYKYILNAKPGDHKTLFEFADGVCTNYTIKKGGIVYQYRYANSIPLSDSRQDIHINFLECIETSLKVSKTFTWVANLEITENTIHQIMQGGRARWKIENETFNALKNQGYQFEHNFGDGQKNLSTVFAMLMVFAFLIDQTQELCDALFQAALKKEGKRSYLWKKMQSLFLHFFINSWEDLWRAIAQGYKQHVLQYNTS
jgi:hypothetical protein